MKNPEGTRGETVSPGHLIGGGRYSLHVPLGDGGLMWLAQDEEQQHLAAIRFLPAEFRQDARAVGLLRTRVEAARTVQQENVGRILEWYESPGLETFIATEYIEGKNVVEAMNGDSVEAIPWERIKTVAASMACALTALHRAGVVHHALKPENVMIATDKRVKLLNTVVVGVLRNPLIVPGVLNDPRAVRCFSPQQLSGAEPGTEDDMYSFGATLYEFLTGTPVFTNANLLLQDLQSTPAQPLRERLRAQQVTDGVPQEIVDFITACLSKEAAERPRSFECLLPPSEDPISASPALRVAETSFSTPASAQVLSPVRSQLEVVAQARPVRRRSKAPLVLAAAAVLLAFAAAAWVFIDQQKTKKQRLASSAEWADEQKRAAEQKLQEETAARLKSDEEARRAQAGLAAMAEEKRRIEDEAKARPERELAAQKQDETPQPKKPGAPPKASTSTNGFVVMFNGSDLTNWSGNTNYWSVKDGYITAQSKADDAKQRHLLVWQKGPMSDFELQFSYRFRVLRGNKQPNGGVNYRLTGETNLTCYQFDLVASAKDNGSVNDDRKRARLAGFGESVIATASGTNKTELLEQVGDTNKLNAIRHEDWNRCVIIAKGNRLTHYINGTLVADVTDENKRRHTQGLIALELYTRNTNNCATFLQFNDLKVKKLSSGSNPNVASANR